MTHELAYLWEPPHGRYFLVGSPSEEYGYVIWDSLAERALIIEDDDVYETVLARMEKAGVPIVPSIPDGSHRGGTLEQ